MNLDESDFHFCFFYLTMSGEIFSDFFNQADKKPDTDDGYKNPHSSRSKN